MKQQNLSADKTDQHIRAIIDESISIRKAMLADAKLIGQLAHLAATCLNALKSGGKIIFAGNGGSFADAQHLSAEFTSRFQFDRAPLPSLALGTNSSAFSAIGNDYSFEQVFARELQVIAGPHDVFIPISTSGNSTNILRAVETAVTRNIAVTAWTGQSGGKLKALCDCICIPSTDTARIQECHILAGHILCELVETGYFR